MQDRTKYSCTRLLFFYLVSTRARSILTNGAERKLASDEVGLREYHVPSYFPPWFLSYFFDLQRLPKGEAVKVKVL